MTSGVLALSPAIRFRRGKCCPFSNELFRRKLGVVSEEQNHAKTFYRAKPVLKPGYRIGSSPRVRGTHHPHPSDLSNEI